MLQVKQGAIKRMIEDKYLDSLDKDGRRIMQECLAEKDYRNQSGNLAASYGYGVYAWGKLVRFGNSGRYVPRGEEKDWYGEKLNGMDEIAKFLEPEGGEVGYKPNPRTIELVIVAAMPYGEPLEFNTNGARRRKYKVTAMAYDKLKLLQTKYPRTTVSGLLRGKKV